MAKPNPNPKIQKKIPIMSKRWPSTPRKVTDERSGSLRLASPPTCSGCASAAEAKTVRDESVSPTTPTIFAQRDAKLADQMRMVIPPNLQQYRNITGLDRVSAAKFALPVQTRNAAALRSRQHNTFRSTESAASDL